jgi:hypothetical protein
VCIIRWDREGAIVTKPIAYNEELSLVRFLSLYSQASKLLHGIDITVSPAPEDEAESTRRNLKLSLGTPMFKTSIPRVKPPITQPEWLNLTIVFPPLILSHHAPLVVGHVLVPHMLLKGAMLCSSRICGASAHQI